MSTPQEALNVQNLLEKIGFDKNFAVFLKSAFSKATLAAQEIIEDFHPDLEAEHIGFYISSYPHPTLAQLEVHVRPVFKTVNGYFSVRHYRQRINSWKLSPDDVEKYVIKKEDINFTV